MIADRYAQPGGVGSYQPDHPAATDQAPYLDYLDRIESGAPTGRARLQQLHPDPPCHTGGAGPLSGCPCMVNA